MLSERWLTTQASVALRSATATGSSPTGTENACSRPVAVTSNASSRPSGVFTAYRRDPSGASASGRTWPDSNVTNDPDAAGRGGDGRAPIFQTPIPVRHAATVTVVRTAKGIRCNLTTPPG